METSRLAIALETILLALILFAVLVMTGWLSGANVRAILLFVYTISGIMAGLGGVLASQLKSGAPTYGGYMSCT